MTDAVTPINAGTPVGLLIGGKVYGFNLLNDTAGADAMGVVTDAPVAFSLLGRLKAIFTALTAGPKTAATSLSVAPSSDGFAVSVSASALPAGAATKAAQDALLAATAVTASPFTITPSAGTALERETKAISIATGGTLVFRHPDETTDRTITLPAGFFPMRATFVRTASTAAGLTGF